MLSEIISFSEFYNTINEPHRVAIPIALYRAVPFIFQVLKELCPGINLVMLDDKVIYRFRVLITRRNRWFNFIRHWEAIPFEQIHSKLIFEDLQSIGNDFIDDIRAVCNFSRRTYENSRHRIQSNNKYIMVKTVAADSLLTPQRALHITKEARDIALSQGYQFLSITDFEDLNEYVATLYSAKSIVLSYGAITCANRFFLSPDASVLLIANMAYKEEYEAGNNFWHIRHSHLCPVKRQHVLLDFPNRIDVEQMLDLLSNASHLDE